MQIPQINIGDAKYHLSPIMDMFNGGILCYTISGGSKLKMMMDMSGRLYRKRVRCQKVRCCTLPEMVLPAAYGLSGESGISYL